MPFHLGVEISEVKLESGKPVLHLTDGEGKKKLIAVDHVIAGTGYQVDVEKLQPLSPSIRRKIKTTGKAPSVSASFESSVPRLYFVGVSSANTFGPLMRFAFGADYTARRITKYLARPSRSRVYGGAESARAIEHV